MARKRWRPDARPCELNLTAMIDVAFQLLSFFLITVKPVDVLADLTAYRPMPDQRQKNNDPNTNMIKIMIMPGVYVYNDRSCTPAELDRKLEKAASADPTQTILIMCANQSLHEQLIELLDKCAKWKLTNLSVVSSGGI